EGFQEKGASVVIVDDVCTTGSSTIQAIEAAREFGFKVIGTACLVEREEAGGRAAVEKAAAPALFISIFKASEVKARHVNRRSRAYWDIVNRRRVLRFVLDFSFLSEVKVVGRSVRVRAPLGQGYWLLYGPSPAARDFRKNPIPLRFRAIPAIRIADC